MRRDLQRWGGQSLCLPAPPCRPALLRRTNILNKQTLLFLLACSCVLLPLGLYAGLAEDGPAAGRCEIFGFLPSLSAPPASSDGDPTIFLCTMEGPAEPARPSAPLKVAEPPARLALHPLLPRRNDCSAEFPRCAFSVLLRRHCTSGHRCLPSLVAGGKRVASLPADSILVSALPLLERQLRFVKSMSPSVVRLPSPSLPS